MYVNFAGFCQQVDNMNFSNLRGGRPRLCLAVVFMVVSLMAQTAVAQTAVAQTAVAQTAVAPAPSPSSAPVTAQVPLPSGFTGPKPDVIANILKTPQEAATSSAPSVSELAHIALAELNDGADVAAAQRKLSLYRQLMDLNGTATNIRLIMSNAKDIIRTIVIERAGVTTLSAEQMVKYNQIATRILKETENTILQDIALAQSRSFSEDEIKQLISVNSTVAAAKYNSGKFSSSAAMSEQVQSYMVDAVVKIIKTFKQTITS
jgi:hypothetical protein